jgi:hypothetical protein
MLFPEDLSPELNCFFVAANRHDRDRIELQFGFDGLLDQKKEKFQYTVEFLMFVPRSLGLLEVDSYSALRQEVQSYVRLHTHVTNPNSPTSLSRVQERLELLKQNLGTETLKSFAVDFEGFIKAQTRRFKRRINEVAKDSSSMPEMKDVLHDAHIIEHLLDDFRSIIRARGIEKMVLDKFNLGKTDHDLLLLNEYLSHVYVQHLGEVQDHASTLNGLDELKKTLVAMSAKEALVREAYHFVIEERQGRESSEAMEHYPRRSSVLKKYFQRPLFIKDSGAPLEKRLLIPVYAVSAAIAASFAILFQIYYQTSTTERVGINSIALVSLGVFAYVAKDLMKDYFRKFFLKTGGKYFSDNERKLFMENAADRSNKRIGKISEYFNTPDVKHLPDKIQRIRYSVPGGDLERELGEDCVHFKKRVSLDLEKLDAKREFPWGVREIVRYRLDRLLPNMEDAFKKMFFVSKTGHVAYRQSHRLYHAYLMAWIHAETPPKARPIKPEFRAFQIAIDKTGILSCKRLDWDKQFGVPPRP